VGHTRGDVPVQLISLRAVYAEKGARQGFPCGQEKHVFSHVCGHPGGEAPHGGEGYHMRIPGPIGGVEGPPDKENRSLATLRFSIWHSLADLYPQRNETTKVHATKDLLMLGTWKRNLRRYKNSLPGYGQ